jgi:hypothetical protein
MNWSGSGMGDDLWPYFTSQPRDFLVASNMFGQVCRHRRGDPQRLVDTGEVEMNEGLGDYRRVIFNFSN